MCQALPVKPINIPAGQAARERLIVGLGCADRELEGWDEELELLLSHPAACILS